MCACDDLWAAFFRVCFFVFAFVFRFSSLFGIFGCCFVYSLPCTERSDDLFILTLGEY